MKTKNLSLKPLTLALALLPGLVLAESLDNIVVTASKTEQDKRSTTGSITVINRQQIEQGQYRSFADALKTVPGVYIKHTGGIGQSTSIFLRGTSSSDRQVLILVDGVEQTDPSGMGADIANLQLDNVERIEILKGPQSGIWGANASAGVINIITRKSGQQASVFVEAGSFNSKTLSANLGAGNDQVDFAVSLFDQRTDGFSAVRAYNESHNEYEADGFNRQSVSFKLGLNINKRHRIETLLKDGNSLNEFDGTSAPDESTYNNTYRNQTHYFQYTYQGNDFKTRLFLNENRIDRTFTMSSTSTYEGLVTEAGLVSEQAYGLNNALTLSINEKQYSGKSPWDNNNQLTDYRNTGLVISNRNQIGTNLFIDQAIRYDRYSDFKDAVTGRLGIKQYFAPEVFASASFGTGYNAPSIYHATNPNNPNELEPESVEGYEATLTAYGLSLTIFNRSTENLITSEGTWPNNYYINQDGKTTQQGLELNWIKTLKPIDTDVSFNYTAIEAKNKDDELLAYIPENQANLKLNYYGLDRTQLGVETRYIGTQYPADNQQGQQIGEYFVVDLNANYDVNKHFTVQAKIVNALNNDYVAGVADFPATNTPPNYVYSNGGTQLFIGLRGQM